METIQPILDTLTVKYPWLATLLLAMGTARLLLKFFSGTIQKSLTGALQRVVETTETDDDSLAEAILTAKWYRFLAFATDMLVSIKLPTKDSLTALYASKKVQP